MGKLYAKITLSDGAVTEISDSYIQIDDKERGTYECVEVQEEPYGGLQVGDILKTPTGQHFRDVPFKDNAA